MMYFGELLSLHMVKCLNLPKKKDMFNYSSNIEKIGPKIQIIGQNQDVFLVESIETFCIIC